MAKPRGRVIDETVIEVVEHLLDKWTGKLTWDLLIAAIKAAIATEYTRQALLNHPRIAQAFSTRKLSLAKEQGRPQPQDARTLGLLKTIDTLKAENARLMNECVGYRAKFIRWTHNASAKGFTEAQLDVPLPPSLRDSTDDKIVSLNKGRKAKNGKQR
ncbi:hypothetical protein [Rugamonas apoptosis]|uniref:Uncharacterized protein n=1 Tax=Rugamonas apoptosis TaxID=2758570 RepID=A0A7W2F6N3_9BURK|nr:hypothetical protein [Rugamonas apoptosis]MBA5686081.1 hypothetical protein [Rugamonas apoptosis]